MEEVFYYIALSLLPGIGAVHTKNLISYCGDAKSVFTQSKGKLLKIPGIGPKIVQGIQTNQVFKLAEAEMAFISKHNIKVLPYTHIDYPKRLAHCSDSPILLYAKGMVALNNAKSIAVVGTRKATKYGKDFVHDFLQELQDTGVLVVSGMALGIDAQAHKSALEFHLPTVGVLGHPLNTIYPASHTNLAKEMIGKDGMLISEYASCQAILPSNFPMRNRLIAGMTDATVIIESARKGGAVITANIANSYNRDVFALPGRYRDKYAAGCNFLLKTHRANMIESAQDLLQQMGWHSPLEKPKRIQRELALDLGEEEQKIIAVLRDTDGMQTDAIMFQTNLSSGTIANKLLELELKGIIHALPGNRFVLS